MIHIFFTIPHRGLLKVISTKIMLMLVLALSISIMSFYLMDMFVVSDADEAPSRSCTAVSRHKEFISLFITCQVA